MAAEQVLVDTHRPPEGEMELDVLLRVSHEMAETPQFLEGSAWKFTLHVWLIDGYHSAPIAIHLLAGHMAGVQTLR